MSSLRPEQVSAQLKDTKFAQEGVMLEKCAKFPRVTLAQLKPSLSSRIADVAGLFPHAQQILQDAR
jgi:hypothetical protein